MILQSVLQVSLNLSHSLLRSAQGVSDLFQGQRILSIEKGEQTTVEDCEVLPLCALLLRGQEGHQEGGHGVTDSLGSTGTDQLLVLAHLAGHQSVTKVLFFIVAGRSRRRDRTLLDHLKSLLNARDRDRPVGVGLKPLSDSRGGDGNALGLKLTLDGGKLMKESPGETRRTRRGPVSLDSLLAVGANRHVSMGRELGTLGRVEALCCNESTHASLLEQVVELETVALVVVGHLDAEAGEVDAVDNRLLLVFHLVPRGWAVKFILPRPCKHYLKFKGVAQAFFFVVCRLSDICSVFGCLGRGIEPPISTYQLGSGLEGLGVISPKLDFVISQSHYLFYFIVKKLFASLLEDGTNDSPCIASLALPLSTGDSILYIRDSVNGLFSSYVDCQTFVQCLGVGMNPFIRLPTGLLFGATNVWSMHGVLADSTRLAYTLGSLEDSAQGGDVAVSLVLGALALVGLGRSGHPVANDSDHNVVVTVTHEVQRSTVTSIE